MRVKERKTCVRPCVHFFIHGICFFFSTRVGFRANEDVVETAWKAPSGNELPQLYLLGSCGYTPTRSCLHICTPRLYLDRA
uniref:Tick transposon n=1 Tax=Rhipicephalus zambeziensis TaxID=60191 RepID=A0A224ZA18_9ACAR